MPAEGFAHQLLIRRSTDKKQLASGRLDYEYAYFLIRAPAADPVTEAIVRAGVCWKIEEYKEPLYAAPPLLQRMVDAGRLGRKSGSGFYTY
ncbi:hypothetical protein GCM10010317_027150 [Streptomyces mirabilis]|nr:hypothetical protein GCM10010317_027150 [Streptomyces mirabilis]